ncbi:HlyD family efflux transporter periplasmic adaptor subunit [Cyanobium sp. FGCU-6]|nr:HlyD family efflux transporter periplasmic adaptor subunit [Cyanobium sp. FGCU6]
MKLARRSDPHTLESDSLRLESRPTPWLPLIIGGSMAALVLTAIGASSLVKVDQVVPVPGKLETIRSTQDVKTTEPGVVRIVLVREGERVSRGQPLVVLDAEVLQGRRQALSEQRGQLREMSRAELDRLASAMGESRSEITGLRAQRAIIQEQIQRLAQLEAEGGASRFQLLEYERQLSEVNAKIERNEQSIERMAAESRQKQAELLQQAAENRASRVETEQRLRQVVVRATLDGTILNLKAKPGQVVAGGEVLLQLVPLDSLEAQVFVPNRDLAFVRPGQQADLTIEAYDPARYGRLPAKVTTIGTDALPPDDTYKFPRFPVSLRLSRQTLEHEGKQHPLQAGMAVTAQLKLEKRSLLDLFFSGLLRTGDAVRTIR